MPKISICATCYNHERFLPDFMDSVLSQQFDDWELIVVDDCSTDGSWTLLQTYGAKDPRIRVFRNDRNRHLCHTGNRAAELANGEILTILSCDDMFLPGKLANDCQFFDEHPAVSVLYTAPSVLAIDGQPVRNFPLPAEFSRLPLLRRELFEANVITIPGMSLRREAWRSVGGYHPLLRLTQDHDLHLKLLERFEVARTPRPTVSYRLHAENLSVQNEVTRQTLFNEQSLLLVWHFLSGVRCIDDLVRVIPECLAYGEPLVETIPYFVSRYAIEHGMTAAVRYAGLSALYRYLENPSGRQLLEERYGFLSKDFMKIAEIPLIGKIADFDRFKPAFDRIERSVAYRVGMGLTWPARTAWRLARRCGRA